MAFISITTLLGNNWAIIGSFFRENISIVLHLIQSFYSDTLEVSLLTYRQKLQHGTT